jgi:hypothetical protein
MIQLLLTTIRLIKNVNVTEFLRQLDVKIRQSQMADEVVTTSLEVNGTHILIEENA